jgi:hypothetical protein
MSHLPANVKIVAMKVTVKEILNEDKTLKETVTKIVGYWPFVYGVHPDAPAGSTFVGAQSPYRGYVPSNYALPQTPEAAEALYVG